MTYARACCVCRVCCVSFGCMYYYEAISLVVHNTTTALTVMLTSTPEKHCSKLVALLSNLLC